MINNHKNIYSSKLQFMKKWYTSKTIWFNVISTILGIVAELSNTFPVSDHPKLWISIVAVGNIILRFLTTEPITSAPTE